MSVPAPTGAPPLPELGDRGDVPLVDLLDRLLEKGVAASGDVVLSVAGVDLVWLSLRAVLKGIDGREKSRRASVGTDAGASSTPIERVGAPPVNPRNVERTLEASPARRRTGDAAPTGPPRLGIDQEDVDRGLVQLVLTVVDLLRELMERQALRRAEGPDMSDCEVEQLGVALMRLDERMRDLKAHFGFSDTDLRPHLRDVTAVS